MRESATLCNRCVSVLEKLSSLPTAILAILACAAVALFLMSMRPATDAAHAAVMSGASAQSVLRGRASIIDGDTIEIDGRRVRIEGIDAPELGQRCPRRWVGTWRCGRSATRALRRLISGKEVSCQRLGADKYSRVIARCHAAGTDIGAYMVRTGYAWAFVKYSNTYVAEEAAARRARNGIWSGRPAQPAWEYRHRHWVSAEQKAPEGCPIKGNISSKGRIYHPPWSPWYARTTITKEQGERWFCSEAEAMAAGWRPVAIN